MTKKRILPPDRIAECLAAHELFLSKKNALGLSQKKIADEAGMTPAAVNLYFKGINPLNVQFAGVLSRMLGEPVEKFSPRLADEIKALTTGVASAKIPASTGSGSGSTGDSGAARKVLEMIQKHSGKGLDQEAQERIATAALMVAAETKGKVIEVDFSRPGKVGDEVWIAHYDIRGAMGGGEVTHDYPEMLQDVRVSPSHLRSMGVEFKEHYHLKMVTGWGQSMTPTIKHGDPLLVDISIREFIGDGIYLLSYQGLEYIKRLQRKGKDKYRMLSDNTLHPPEEIWAEETYIQARILLVWNAHLL